MSSIGDGVERVAAPPAQSDDWPADGLEWLGCCPVCASKGRETLYSGLRDIVFGSAPGRWTMHRCLDCGTAYLDPRPDAATIGLAYRNYFTHSGVGRDPVGALTPGQYVARAIANGYRNRRFGTREAPASRFGGCLVPLWPPLRRHLDQSFRCLTREHAGRRVLDVGCGGGNFLYWAHAMGCRVAGSDPDPVAVANARAAGLDVREGGIEAFTDCPGQFDVVSFAHVVEHLHDPVGALRLARTLLRPAGTLWLETPNFDSVGRKHYGPVWRGLEIPRHLVLFTPASIRRTLDTLGFRDIRFHRANGATVLKESERLAAAHPELVGDAPGARELSADSELMRITALSDGIAR